MQGPQPSAVLDPSLSRIALPQPGTNNKTDGCPLNPPSGLAAPRVSTSYNNLQPPLLWRS